MHFHKSVKVLNLDKLIANRKLFFPFLVYKLKKEEVEGLELSKREGVKKSTLKDIASI